MHTIGTFKHKTTYLSAVISVETWPPEKLVMFSKTFWKSNVFFPLFQTTSKSDVRSYARSATFRTGFAQVLSPLRSWSARATVSRLETYPGTPSLSRYGLAPRFWSGDAWRTISVVRGLSYSVKMGRHARIGSKWLRVVSAKDTWSLRTSQCSG